MEQREFQETLESNGFIVEKSFARKSLKGFNALIWDSGNAFHGYLAFSGNPGEAKEKLAESLEQAMEAKKFTSYYWDEENRLLTIKSESAQARETVLALDEIAEKAQGLGLSSGCPNCGSGEGTGYARIDGRIAFLCEACIEKHLLAEKAEAKPTKILTGLLGAVLGAIVGSIVWILIGLLGFYASLAGLAISLAALFGYKLFKGPKSWVSIPIVIVAVLYAVIQAEIIGLVITIMKTAGEEGIQLSIGDTLGILPVFMQEPEVNGEVIKSLLLGLLFAGLGSWRPLKALVAESKKIVIERI